MQLSETYQRAVKPEADGFGFRPDILLSEVEREAIASIGRLSGGQRENETCIGRVLKQIAQERIQAEGNR